MGLGNKAGGPGEGEGWQYIGPTSVPLVASTILGLGFRVPLVASTILRIPHYNFGIVCPDTPF